jgi:hypothetical protein
MTNSTINITGLNENMVSGFFAKGNRLWFGNTIDPDNTVTFEGDTDEDFFNAAREAISRMGDAIGEDIGFYAVPILDEFDWAGGQEGDVGLCAYDTAKQNPL